MTDVGPIIVIGAARSGTKYLRDLLAASPAAKCVPYDVNYIWRYGSKQNESDELKRESLTDESIQYIRSSLNKLAGVTGDEILIEKTVSNSLRVPFVDRVFPAAQYVHIIRDGRDVVESSMRQWNAKPNVKRLVSKLVQFPIGSRDYLFWFARNFASGLVSGRAGGQVWGPRIPSIVDAANQMKLAEVCALQWKYCVERAQQDLNELPDSSAKVVTIRYEDLVSSEEVMVGMLDRLSLSGKDEVLEFYHQNTRPSEPAQWKKLGDEDQSAMLKIVESVNPIRTKL